ncbi:MAG TPA: hypothetical protein VEV37_06695 [Bryobacteraceae bacterium]|nr:hypothetical protein [Bryobacteraceae bacterium]
MLNVDSSLPSGVRAIAVIFALCGLYLVIAGLVMLLRPGLISMSAGSPLLFGLELAGPYMFLLTGAAGIAIAFGLLRRINFVRHIAMIAAIAGVVMLVPPVSAAAVLVEPGALVRGGLGIIVRVVITYYLSRKETAEEFGSI